MVNLALFAQLALASTAFADGGALPTKHGCGGSDASPSIELQHPPLDATHWALVVDDPDSGAVLWAVWNIPILERFLDEGMPKNTTTTRPTQGRNHKKRLGWVGPCPASGATNTVRFRAFALKRPLGLSITSTGGDVLEATKGFVTIESAELRATYQK